MELVTFFYKEGQWSVKDFPKLDSENTLVLVFAAPEYAEDPKPMATLAEHYPKSKIIGCSSAGEISGPAIMDKSISVAVAKFESTPLRLAKAEIKDAKNSLEAGVQIAKQLSQPDLRGIFVLSDGLKVNGSELVKGLNSAQGKDVVVTGGLAGDGSRFQKTWAVYAGKVEPNQVVAVGFYGDKIKIGHASRGGWDIFGPERRVTRAKDNVLYELDNKPALTLYKEYLGDRASGLPAAGLLFPLAIRKDDRDQKQLVRTILAVDEKDQSLTFAGDIPNGYLAQLMRANFDRLIISAGEAGETAKKMVENVGNTTGPVLAVAVSCVGRRLLLGERTEEETESTLASLPEGSQQVGFYSYGELSPYGVGTCDLHNQTMTLTTFSEG